MNCGGGKESRDGTSKHPGENSTSQTIEHNGKNGTKRIKVDDVPVATIGDSLLGTSRVNVDPGEPAVLRGGVKNWEPFRWSLDQWKLNLNSERKGVLED